jgi:hypothetical protein
MLLRYRAERGLGQSRTASPIAVRIADERGVSDASAGQLPV